MTDEKQIPISWEETFTYVLKVSWLEKLII